jgi:hypothetical protein
MDLLSLLLAAVMAAGSAGATSDAGGSDEVRSQIIDIGQPAASEQPPPPSDDMRSTIIEIG